MRTRIIAKVSDKTFNNQVLTDELNLVKVASKLQLFPTPNPKCLKYRLTSQPVQFGHGEDAHVERGYGRTIVITFEDWNYSYKISKYEWVQNVRALAKWIAEQYPVFYNVVRLEIDVEDVEKSTQIIKSVKKQDNSSVILPIYRSRLIGD